MNNEKARFVWVPLLIAVAIAGGILIGRFFSADTSFGKTARYDKIESLLQCIEQQYVDTVNRNDLRRVRSPLCLHSGKRFGKRQ